MVDWNKIKCYECGKCNKKGLPSVSKGSAFCQKRRGLLTLERTSKWSNFKMNLQQFLIQKGFMRRAGAPRKERDEDEEEKENV